MYHLDTQSYLTESRGHCAANDTMNFKCYDVIFYIDKLLLNGIEGMLRKILLKIKTSKL